MSEEQTQTPLEALTHMYETAPEVIKPLLNNAIRETIGSIMPRIAAQLQQGPLMTIEELRDYKVGDAFAEAILEVEDQAGSLPDRITPTIRETGRDIGTEIDAAIDRVLISHTEDYVLRDAHMDIVGGHAALMRGLSALGDVPAGIDMTREEDSNDE